ncbi:TetR/AcrR family transcriptional regulator [Hoeflea prorocentri]|uniref:Helix-turn-helix domain containing protein n=1 Tax=Hoeflea prorocentri TaxID=1922333 RepID=A0A9X3UKA9_9HYPH|nr:TetR/AcrR family transcriptional regulator [Hoeflea prorocentri]MCY6382117.1 helix-turn-helix domain containing protein [Hoeflea prorocentri]MDA5399917.1 helix-turn-helix domain containing protein [Hoeflea prorocentri]
MPRDGEKTRTHILKTANVMFYADGIRATGVDAIAEKAGVTKRTLYYHFRSKDDLIAHYLQSRDAPNLAVFQAWFAETGGDMATRVEVLFTRLAEAGRRVKWRGCAFLRTAGELANMPGHPAIKAASEHKKRIEVWLADEFAAASLEEPQVLARQVALLMDGAFAVTLVHHDAAYFEAAGRAAAALISGAGSGDGGAAH